MIASRFELEKVAAEKDVAEKDGLKIEAEAEAKKGRRRSKKKAHCCCCRSGKESR